LGASVDGAVGDDPADDAFEGVLGADGTPLDLTPDGRDLVFTNGAGDTITARSGLGRLPGTARPAAPGRTLFRYGRDGSASCASWRACCGNQSPAAGSSMPHSGSKSAWSAVSVGQPGCV
jgi:hypothetical protein